MGLNIATQVTINLTIVEQLTLGFVTSPVQDQILPVFALTAGVGSSQNDLHYEDVGRVLAAGSTETYILSALSDSQGRTIAFVKVRVFMIEITARTAADYLTVGDPGGVGTHVWTAIVGGATQSFKVFDFEMKIAQLTDGFAVTSGSNDQIRITNSGANPITYNFALTGTSS